MTGKGDREAVEGALKKLLYEPLWFVQQFFFQTAKKSGLSTRRVLRS